MKKDTEITKVIFRKFKPTDDFACDIIALFPEDSYAGRYTTLAYVHVGQHFEVDYKTVIKQSVPATENEYKDLKTELENGFDYNFKVLKRAKIIYK
jgi:hypothetical protein